jgi:hypothetical protein
MSRQSEEAGKQDSRPSRSALRSWSLWSEFLRIPVEILQIPLDTFLYGLDCLAEKSELSSGPPATAKLANADREVIPAQAPPAPAIVPAPEFFVRGLDRIGPDSLRGSALKLVRSRVLFIKRGYEFAFPAQEDLFSDDLEIGVFEAWKIAEFVQRLADPENAPEVPPGWSGYLPPGCRHAHGQLRRFPTGDSKYLRVFFEVLNYYPRESLRYRESHLKLLREIGKALEERSGVRDAAGSS